ncbi:SDR family oxidoreductase [Limnoglobus roseus]|uniref:Short chain dehydrogenase n=1 Tax=Limnoglobus roseus TaxID=2598579 RepID=A0A5C1ANL5_9BACT|nr:SDR family oxidoreductase [Limnoglobus roseus]QEL18448.1 short chain dehydrogenase [Limnoglobus roseus]
MARRELSGLRVLVTGASQGIGRAIATTAAKAGCKVIASARSAEMLAELAADVRAAGGTIETVASDITKSQDREAMIAAAQKHFGGLDVLINNAGIGATGHFMDSDPQVLRDIFETNYFALCELTRLAIPLLKQGRTPQIVNISSVVARRAYPARSLYSSSKFAVAGFSEALRSELSKDGVDVLVVNPGLTQTNFSKNMLEAKAKQSLDHKRGMTSEEVAEATLAAMRKGSNEITLTLQGKMLVLVTRFFPWLFDIFAKKKVRKLFAEEIAARKKAVTS